jgi:hypothetical protein
MSPRGSDSSAGVERMSIGGAVAAMLVVLAGGVVVWSLVVLLATAFVETPATREASSTKPAAHEDRLARYVDQFNGRTMFFTPAKPPPARVERAPVVDNGPRIEPPPARYGGPSIIGMANDTIWFSDKRHMIVGGEAVGDLRVLSTDGAWQVRVEWKGVAFEVPFLKRDGVILPPGSQSERAEANASAEIATAESENGQNASGAPSESAEESEQDPGSREPSQPGDEQ